MNNSLECIDKVRRRCAGTIIFQLKVEIRAQATENINELLSRRNGNYASKNVLDFALFLALKLKIAINSE